LRLLLDTHFAAWLTLDEDRLTNVERRQVEAEGVEIVCSTVSLWELRLKWNSTILEGIRKGAVSPDAVLAFGQRMDWTFLPLLAQHAVAALEIPIAHKDPFDELLLAQAQVEGLPLMTRDRALIGHPLAMR
jgi:PIN domain nuclease of toxin-antitoxin system